VGVRKITLLGLLSERGLMMQNRCPYYAEYRGQVVAGEGDVQPKTNVSPLTPLPYCNHKHSPAPRDVVLHAVGGSLLLKCGGDVAKCEVPKEERLDL
jgi:hypothetical protein